MPLVGWRVPLGVRRKKEKGAVFWGPRFGGLGGAGVRGITVGRKVPVYRHYGSVSRVGVGSGFSLGSFAPLITFAAATGGAGLRGSAAKLP